MTSVNLPDVLRVVRDIVLEADNEGKLQHLTPRIVRQETEQYLSLESGCLEAKEFKVAVKKAIEDTIAEIPTTQRDKQPEVSSASKPQKKRKSRPSKSIDKDSTKRSKAAKSKEFVNSDVEDEAHVSTASVSKPVEVKQKESPKSKTSAPSSNSKPTISADAGNVKDLKPKSSQGKQNATVTQNPAISVPDKLEEKFESELSELDDEPPKRSKKGKGKDQKSKEEPKTKRKSGEKAAKDLSPDEETIKRLKAIVYACGVRKAWSKELKGLEKPSQQIAHLKTLLNGLGMKGRPSLEQARALKAKRDLEQEIEDVKDFAEKHASDERVSQSHSGKAGDTKDDEDPSDDEDEEDGNDAGRPKRRKLDAKRSIMAFLQDQSDED
ncbi:hypothetical protein BD410DRAFT_786952 [Rickenella mellea]|uniref:DEK C-terminal domain-containing protein n=1 Tax=Rickenella mellea TaxID=50990 RepID=A0A4Y7Q7Y1_9AGAM|nr:hypothetical protein BD410DRAFT_786952 [Rickenella mellea]